MLFAKRCHAITLADSTVIIQSSAVKTLIIIGVKCNIGVKKKSQVGSLPSNPNLRPRAVKLGLGSIVYRLC